MDSIKPKPTKFIKTKDVIEAKRLLRICELRDKENSHEKLVDALDWIKGATDIEEDRCKCGRPTGVLAIYNHAEQALKEVEKE